MLTQEIKLVKDNINRDLIGVFKSQISDCLRFVKSHLEICKEAHLVYISHVSNINPEEEDKWAEETQVLYGNCNEVVYEYLKRVNEKETKEKQRIVSGDEKH